MEYRKESHYIVAYDNENKYRGKWNILTNEFIGIKGSVVKTKPVGFGDLYVGHMDEPLRSAYYFLRQPRVFQSEYAPRVEEIISVGLTIARDYLTPMYFLDDNDRLNKKLVTYLKEHYNGVYSHENLISYRAYTRYGNFLNTCGENKDWALGVLRRLDPEVPIDFAQSMIKRAIAEKIFFTTSYFNTTIEDWYKMSKIMGFSLEVKPNILTNFTILQWTFEQYKNAHYDEAIQAHNNKHWLYYDNDEYVVIPLLSKKDFHDEAVAQDNCVERLYMERVANGNTHVVSIRKKSAPDTPYITCEVTNEGGIIQYRLSHNRSTSGKDSEFRYTYQIYLNQHFRN